MKIVSLNVRNWCCVDNAYIDLIQGGRVVQVKGTNYDAEVGSNGVGKSTVFVDAPLWCLLGKIPNGRRATLLDHGTASVSLVIKDIGEVERIMNPSGKNKLIINEREVANNTLLDELGIYHPDILQHSIFFPQTTIPFVLLRPAEQNTILNAIMKTGYWVDMRKYMLDTTKVLNSKLVTAKAIFSQYNLSSLPTEDEVEERHDLWESARRKRVSEIKHEVSSLDLDIVSCELEIDEVEDELKAAVSEEKELGSEQAKTANENSKINKKRKSHVDDLRTAKALLEDRKKDLEKIVELGECPMCGAKATTRVLKERIEESTNDVAQIGRRLNVYRKAWLVSQEELKEAEDNLSSANRKVIRLEHDCDKLITKLNNMLDKKNDKQSDLYVMMRELNPYTKDLQKVKSRKRLYASMKGVAGRLVDYFAEEYETAKELADHIREFSVISIEESLDALQLETNEVMQRLGLQDTVELSATKTTKAGDERIKLNVQVNSLRGVIPVTSLSGGEITRVAVSMQMAIANLTNAAWGISPTMEVWDEPSGWMSEQGSESLYSMLETRAAIHNRTIYLIDHRELNREDSYVELEKRNGRTTFSY